MHQLVAFATSYLFLWLAVLVVICCLLSWPPRAPKQILLWILAALMVLALVLRLAAGARP